MPRIHLFNPGHEAAVLSGRGYYTPPRNVRQMQRDLALLPLWYADPGDYVWTGKAEDVSFLPAGLVLPATAVAADNLPDMELTAMPWGLSPQSIRLFGDIIRKYGARIDVPEWKEAYTRLTGRQTAAVCLNRIREKLTGWTFPASPVFCRTMDEVEACLPAYTGACLLKTPFSSSGRGLFWVTENRLSAKDREWIGGALHRQGCISVEQGLDKVCDFAMEFRIDPDGNVRYEGLSLFATAEKGAYAGNRLEPQACMLDELTGLAGAGLYEILRNTVAAVLQEIFGGIYAGYIGMDMLLYRDATGRIAIHPCVEINMRYTMGMAAIRLFRQYIHPEASGVLRISYGRDAGREHERMKAQYPPVVEDGRIRYGYQTLCPVTAETRYRAFVVIEEKSGV